MRAGQALLHKLEQALAGRRRERPNPPKPFWADFGFSISDFGFNSHDQARRRARSSARPPKPNPTNTIDAGSGVGDGVFNATPLNRAW